MSKLIRSQAEMTTRLNDQSKAPECDGTLQFFNLLKNPNAQEDEESKIFKNSTAKRIHPLVLRVRFRSHSLSNHPSTVHPACLEQTAKTQNSSLSPPKTKYQEAINLLFASTLQPSNPHITTSCTPPYHSSPTTQIKHTTFFFNSNGRSASSTAPSASGARSPAGTTGLHAQRKRRSFGRYPQRCQLEESYNCR